MITVNREDFDNLQDEAHLWQSSALGGLELLRARYVRFSFAPHSHDEYMIAVTEAGVGSPRFLGGEHTVGPGAVIVLNPGEVHEGGPAAERSWRYRALCPPAALMARVALELNSMKDGGPRFSGGIVIDPFLAGLLLRAHRALDSSGAALAGEVYLLDALAGLIERHGVDRALPRWIGQESRAVKRAIEYLHSLPHENVSLASLAQVAGLSAFHLTRVFRRETCLTPHAYQILIRARLAKDLMTNGLPISRAALDAGFVDQAHFTRHFKRIFGVTPGSYLSARLPRGSGNRHSH